MPTKRLLSTLIFALLIAGCVTVPSRQMFPTYSINGAEYLPLVSLCNARGINLQYDVFTQSVILKKDSHRVNMRVGDTLVLVDGSAQHLDSPVDIYKGAIVVPYGFKERIADSLFKESYSIPQVVSPILNIRKVVLDPGHGGNDPGAIGRTGLREKDINLDIAKRLSNLLQKRGVQVVMTRSSDRFIPLETRVDIANNSGADLFISIHSNANRVHSLNGFEVYYVSSTVSDSKRALAAARSATLHLNNAFFASGSPDLKATVWDMIYTANRAESVELARSICRLMDNSGCVKILGIKSARFEVLRGARMPAVLVEVGFLSNIDEERMLRNSYSRERIAEAIVQGVEDYAETCNLMETVKK